MKFSFSCVALCAVVSASLGLALPAQENRGVSSVMLSVKDQSGAAIPNAQVRIVPTPNGAEQKLKTDIDGNLSFEMPSGSYDLTVESRGFRSVIKHVDAKPSSRQEIEVVLEVGQRFCPVCEDSEPLLKPSVPPIQSRLYPFTDAVNLPRSGGPIHLVFPQVMILTPHEGVDFTSYTTRLLLTINSNWYPDESKGKARVQDSLSVIFKIRKNGRLDHNPTVEVSSGKKPVDDGAVTAIRVSAPFEHLPKSFTGPYIELRVTFVY
jgi:hypothetical protein